MLRLFCIAALVLALATVATAQVPHAFDAYQPSFQHTRSSANVNLPAMDIHKNMAEAKKDERMDGVWDFAQINRVHHVLQNDSSVAHLETGTLSTFSVSMPNALSMAFYFDQFYIPEGGALFLVSERETAGPFTHRNNWSTNDFQTRHIRGNHVQAQYFQESGVTAHPLLHLSVVTTAFREAHDRQEGENAQTCNINAVCVDADRCNAGCEPTDASCSVQCTFKKQKVSQGKWAGADWHNQIRGTVAVARNYASRYCSGSFINNKNGKQYVLTAAHCGPSGSDIILLNFENPVCTDDDDEAGPTSYSAGDLTTLVRNEDVDNELIEVGESIPSDWNVYLNGYDSTDEHDPATSVVGIHHPAGSNKKISYGGEPVTAGRWVGSSSDNHWRVESWTVGTTEGGSSGSPLFNEQTKRIIGQLHGGTAACPAGNGWDVYGAIWAGYTSGGMKQYLGDASMDGEDLVVAKQRSIVA